MNGDGWDLAEEVAYRKSLDEFDEKMRTIPLPRFTAKSCDQGAHFMRRDAAGLRCWQCVRCSKRQPFNIAGDQ